MKKLWLNRCQKENMPAVSGWSMREKQDRNYSSWRAESTTAQSWSMGMRPTWRPIGTEKHSENWPWCTMLQELLRLFARLLVSSTNWIVLCSAKSWKKVPTKSDSSIKRYWILSKSSRPLLSKTSTLKFNLDSVSWISSKNRSSKKVSTLFAKETKATNSISLFKVNWLPKRHQKLISCLVLSTSIRMATILESWP